MERCSRAFLGVFPETFFSTFLEVFTGVSQYVSDGFGTFLANFYFFRGKVDRTLRGPWGPRGPSLFSYERIYMGLRCGVGGMGEARCKSAAL